VTDDRERWARICRGETSAFEAFYRENALRLRSFLWQLVGDRQSAEDIMQETFAQLWQRPNGFHPDRGSLTGYLFGIGRKRAAEWWRQCPEEEIPLAAEPPQRPVEPISLLEDALAKLDPEPRALLWLREVEGQTYAELAQILDIPLGTVKSRLFNAREQLRRIWLGSGKETRHNS
jgi:RNA polymerase sigma-70 factor, ECF subfamily